ncbi:MAG: hypothetical protein LUD27_03150, partial [Clostridia bacterium]|nr:hypothetical protein [Clostridia bacterium]
MKKEKLEKPEMPVSPKSVNECNIVEIGKFWSYVESRKALYTGLTASAVVAFIFVILGLILIAESVVVGLVICLFGIIFGLILALAVKKQNGKHEDVSFEEIGQKKLKEYLDELINSPDRII